MKRNSIVALLLAASALVVAPAFASGYGPSPGYRGTVGAPASQSGPSTQTLAAGRDAAGSTTEYGGRREPKPLRGGHPRYFGNERLALYAPLTRDPGHHWANVHVGRDGPVALHRPGASLIESFTI